DARANAHSAYPKWAVPHLAGWAGVYLLREDEGTVGKLVAAEARHNDIQFPAPHLAVQIVPQDEAQLITAGSEQCGYLINCLVILVLLELVFAHIQNQALPKRVDDATCQTRYPYVDVHDAVHDAIFVLK